MPDVVAVGNRDRGDDGVGPYIVDALKGRTPHANFLTCDGEISGLLELFGASSDMLLIDAADAGAAGMTPGDVLRLGHDDPALADTGLRASTHALGVVEAIALARSLEVLPRKLTVIAIAGSDFRVGAGLSAPVARMADILVDELTAELGQLDVAPTFSDSTT